MRIKHLLLGGGIVALMASCSHDDFSGPVADGQPVEVSITAQLPADMATRANFYDSGTLATKLSYAVYDKNGDWKFDGAGEFTNGSLTTTVKIKLINGEKYKIAFWAQNENSPYTFSGSGKTVTVDFTKTLNNQEDHDAFYTAKEITVDAANLHQSATLTRPFAQINIGTGDKKEVEASGVFPTESAVTLSDAPNQLNLLDGTVEGEAECTFVAKTLPNQGALTVQGKDYTHISMCYVLASDEGDVQNNVTLEVDKINGRSFNLIPVKRNYRTNIVGNLFTSETDWTVEIKPAFKQPSTDKIINIINDEAGLAKAFEEGGDYELATDISMTQTLSIEAGKEVNLNLNDNSLNVSANQIRVGNGGSLKLEGGSFSTQNSGNAGAIQLDGNAKAEIIGVTFTTEDRIGFIAAFGTSELTVTDCVMNGKSYCVSTNAAKNDKPTIKISGTEMSSKTPLLVNVDGKFEFTNCKFNGSMHGAVIRGGTATFTDCEIVMNYPDDNAETMSNYFNERNWGTGNTINLGGLVMGNKAAANATAYQYPTNVTLVNTKVSVEGQYKDLFPAVYAWANAAEGLGVTFTYDAKSSFEGKVVYGNDKKNITVIE